jgi:hypothetical protein
LITDNAYVLPLGYIGYQTTGVYLALPTTQLGNVLRVDAVYGNDSTGNVGSLPYATVAAAITKAATVATVSNPVTIWILPGIYNLAAGITVPPYVSLRGISLQTCIVQMLGVTANTSLITMGENTRVEDLTLKLTSTGHYTLKGVVFGGTTSITSKLRVCTLTVDNSAASYTGTSDVTGVEFSGTGTLGAGSFSFNSIKGSTLNVYSNGGGTKRGVLVNNTNVTSTRDTNIYVAQPTNPTGATGSYVGVETNDPAQTGSIQLRSTTVGTVTPIAGSTYTASDILQTTPTTITNSTYLASAGIQVGPGVDLVTKTAGTKGFSTYNYPTTLFYTVIGVLNDVNASGATGGWLWPGSVPVNDGTGKGVKYPDVTSPYAAYRVQQPLILAGMQMSCATPPGATGSGHYTTVTVQRTPNGGVNPTNTADTVYSLTLTGAASNISKYNASVNFAAGDLLHAHVTYDANTNATADLNVQLDLF